MRIKTTILITAILFPQIATANWTGIAAFVGQHEADWILGGVTLNADSRIYGLQIEERTSIDLRIGARASHNSLRLEDHRNLNQVEEYSVQNLAFYLRWPVALGKVFTLHNRFSYEFNLGSRSGTNNETDIDWIETTYTAGLSARLGHLSIQPFISYRSLNGELTTGTSVRKIELKENQSSGVLLDIHVEPTAYVRLMATFSGADSLLLSFVREY